MTSTWKWSFYHQPPVEMGGQMVFTYAVVRIGDHAHIELSNGIWIVSPGYGLPHANRALAGKMRLRWPDWLILRDALVESARFHIAEVEEPTYEQTVMYAVEDMPRAASQ